MMQPDRQTLLMPSSAGPTKTVVIADDTAFVRDRYRGALEQAGHRVITIKSAAELLRQFGAGREPFDLLVLDLRLSNSSGTSLV